ncbi:hypothetical protein BJF92_08820 [Rhizobium rhizosphaerae]|uniref:Uncharacterized protein n=1 Tax=Xaviernesmea rhizosphaerae TaxID=1672749 RepID=A0A1Q9AHE5_9HYPH|nr:hypothetical protein BJF92_08820 [Xaviernesmea rhizosphaerae]
MTGAIKSPLATSPNASRRAEELDALHAILPSDRHDQLAILLTDEDVATLTQALGYDNSGERKMGRAARLVL